MAPPVATGGACCEACAHDRAHDSIDQVRATMTIDLDPAGGRSLLARRAADRRVTAFAVALAAGYLALTVISLLAPPATRMGAWLPLHLLLAGAAATAIAGVMPFFSAGVASVPPAPTFVRVLGVAGIATGAALIVLVRLVGGGAIDNGALGALAGLTYLLGIAAVAAATLVPLRDALGPRRVVLATSYGVALGCIALGALIGTLAIAGWSPALAAWDVLRPTHAWINVFGFLSLVIGASLLHLLPTVAGTRIERTPASTLVLAGLMIGPLVVAVGFVTRLTLVAQLGALLVVAASLALVWHAGTVLRRRGRWTTDLAWHRFVQGSLLASVGWFAVGALLAAAIVVQGGATARGWDSDVVVGPIALGWAAQALVGSWSHLVPAVGPGTPAVHARQRVLLGRWATPRLLVAQVGIAAVSVGVPTDAPVLIQLGLALVGACAIVAVGLIAAALRPIVPSLVARSVA
jgi:nitrite reductase (NO-forming)